MRSRKSCNAVFALFGISAILSGQTAVADDAATSPAAVASRPAFSIKLVSGEPDRKYMEFMDISADGSTVGSSRADGHAACPTYWNAAGGEGILLTPITGEATGVNASGVIVGRVDSKAVAWRNVAPSRSGLGSSLSAALQGRTLKFLAMPAGVNYATAQGINNGGMIVGQAVRGQIDMAFLRLTNGTVVFLPNLPHYNQSAAYGINDANVIVGASFRDDGSTVACVWRDRKVAPLASLGGQSSEALHINARGDVIGDADLADGKSHACLWPNGGSPVDLGALPGDDTSRALAVNDAGNVVGVSGFKTAFLWTKGTMYPLIDAIWPRPSWSPAQATAINDNGQIAGWGENEVGHVYGFLLTPVPPAAPVSP